MRIALSGRAAGDGDRRARQAVIDGAGTMPGRGAYLCRGVAPGELSGACLALAERRGGVARALRCKVTIPAELLESVGR